MVHVYNVKKMQTYLQNTAALRWAQEGDCREEVVTRKNEVTFDTNEYLSLCGDGFKNNVCWNFSNYVF